jgi:hypothetical protein
MVHGRRFGDVQILGDVQIRRRLGDVQIPERRVWAVHQLARSKYQSQALVPVQPVVAQDPLPPLRRLWNLQQLARSKYQSQALVPVQPVAEGLSPPRLGDV